MNPKARQNGQALFTAIIFLLALTFLGFGLITVATIDIHSSRNLRLSEEALSAAEEGALFALNYAPNHIEDLMDIDHTINIISTTQGGKSAGDRLQYEVTVTLGPSMMPPPGFTTKALFNEIVVRSTGTVSDRAGFTFSATSHSMVQRRVEVLARVQTGYEK